MYVCTVRTVDVNYKEIYIRYMAGRLEKQPRTTIAPPLSLSLSLSDVRLRPLEVSPSHYEHKIIEDRYIYTGHKCVNIISTGT